MELASLHFAFLVVLWYSLNDLDENAFFSPYLSQWQFTLFLACQPPHRYAYWILADCPFFCWSDPEMLQFASVGKHECPRRNKCRALLLFQLRPYCDSIRMQTLLSRHPWRTHSLLGKSHIALPSFCVHMSKCYKTDINHKYKTLWKHKGNSNSLVPHGWINHILPWTKCS